MTEICSNCGEKCCNGIDCYYEDEPSEYVLVLREDLGKAVEMFGQFDNEWIRRLKSAYFSK